jgi:hypothetical protein
LEALPRLLDNGFDFRTHAKSLSKMLCGTYVTARNDCGKDSNVANFRSSPERRGWVGAQ